MTAQDPRHLRVLYASRSEICDGLAADLELADGEVRVVPLTLLHRDLDPIAVAFRQDTLLAIGRALGGVHHDYLAGTLADRLACPVAGLAESTGLEVALIMRATANKLIDCPRGRLELKSLIGAAPGPSVVDAVKRAIAALLEAEDRQAPLTDDQIRTRLAEQAIMVSVDVVTKFRDALAIPPSTRR